MPVPNHIMGQHPHVQVESKSSLYQHAEYDVLVFYDLSILRERVPLRRYCVCTHALDTLRTRKNMYLCVVTLVRQLERRIVYMRSIITFRSLLEALCVQYSMIYPHSEKNFVR